MGQPQVTGIDRQRRLAEARPLLRAPYKHTPVLAWPTWRDPWRAEVLGGGVVLYNRLEMAGDPEGCGPVPLVVKVAPPKCAQRDTAARETSVGGVIRLLVARGVLVNTVCPLFLSGTVHADTPQDRVWQVLVGSATPPRPVADALATAGITRDTRGVVVVALAPVHDCPPPSRSPRRDPFAALHGRLLGLLQPDGAAPCSLQRLLELTEAALKRGADTGEDARALALLLRSVLAQLALAYATVNQAGVQHLDGHLNNVLVSPTAAFDVEARLDPDTTVLVPVRGAFVQVFDWDWSIKWPVPVNDGVLRTAGRASSHLLRVPAEPGRRGFVFDHARRVGNADWTRVLLSVAGQFPRVWRLACAGGWAQRAFGDRVAEMARDSELAVTFVPNEGAQPFEHGHLAVGAVQDCEPCAPTHAVRLAVDAVPLLADTSPGARVPRVTVSLPLFLSDGLGERALDDTPGLPGCSLVPTAAQARAQGARAREAAAKAPAPKRRRLVSPLLNLVRRWR